ncbi:hypothetical protein Gotri_025339 [Gossypium trilobum]|uniref:Uncharacterized protein n=1 Tax=Gossypium trilobum TaxID=34281 RepID=A0A7J9FTS4_9ROSI|nr:hypothetical protein [Gossypium trilobum]
MLHSILQAIVRCYREPALKNTGAGNGVNDTKFLNLQVSVLFSLSFKKNCNIDQAMHSMAHSFHQCGMVVERQMFQKGMAAKSFTSSRFDGNFRSLCSTF